MLCFIVAVVFVVGLCVVYYYYPRKVSFELAKEIDKPYSEFSRIDYVGFDYIENAERFEFFMVYYYNKASCIKAELKDMILFLLQILPKSLILIDMIISLHIKSN